MRVKKDLVRSAERSNHPNRQWKIDNSSLKVDFVRKKTMSDTAQKRDDL